MKNHLLVKAIPWVIFGGLMISSAGIAIFPALAKPPLRIVYGEVRHSSSTYSHKPGQRTVAHSFHTIDKHGRPEQIGGIVGMFAAAIFYSILIYIVTVLIYFGTKIFSKKQAGNPGLGNPS